MQFTTSALAAVLAFTASITATPISARADALKDWQVTSAGTGTPSGRPGSYPWSTLSANITDPNLIDLGPAKDDGTPVTVPAGSQGLVRFTSLLDFTPRTNTAPELPRQILQGREPARPHMALRRYRGRLLDDASPRRL
jgi:hypothetical protein